VHSYDPAAKLADSFMRGEVALVIDEHGKLQALLSKADLIEYLSGHEPTA